jgi:hypothetical protein
MTTMMQTKSILTFFILTALLLAISASPSRADDYTIVGVPRFNFTDGTNNVAGKAFVVQWFRGRTILLAPIHLLGPSGGCPIQMTADDIRNKVRSVDMLDLNGGEVIATAEKSLLSDGATVSKRNGENGLDLVAFEVRGSSRATKLGICATPVAVGTKAWVLTHTDGSSSTRCDRYPGTVSSSDAVDLAIRLDRPLDAHGSSGSPVVDAKGQLIGMMVGVEDDERKVSVCVPATAIYQTLYKAAGQ